LGLFWFRHLKSIKVWIRSKHVFFVKTYKFKITAKNLILSLLTTVGFNMKKNQSNLLQFAV